MANITQIEAYWILDSRGLPTVTCNVVIKQDDELFVGTSAVPSGASTGSYEALELRDNEAAFHGKGVEKAVNNILQTISPAIMDKDFHNAKELDEEILKLDPTENKTNLGANAILAVSMAAHRAFASSQELELWEYLRELYFSQLGDEVSFPRLMCNIINGGAHADSGLAIQEFMVVPKTGDILSDVQMASEVYHTLKKNLKKDGHSISLGDEGGFAPHISTTPEVLTYIQKAISDSKYSTEQYDIALDSASSEFYNKDSAIYTVDEKELTGQALVDFYADLCNRYNILSIEDGLAEDDFASWKLMTEKLTDKIHLIGDDLFVTNVKRFKEVGLDKDIANGVLIKLNQIGSVSETAAMINLAHDNKYVTAISHRSGETTDDFISDLSVACNSAFIKLGAPARGERVAKFNRLIDISKGF
jgi:enolase